ncbi:MAG: hypothetical protein GC157_09970 [Frankiales bacterium]|nr:hypothetical protein [Frankiales bacterium]
MTAAAPTDAWAYLLAETGTGPGSPPPVLAAATPSDGLRDRFVATIVGGAVGDALGRPVERWAREDVASTYPDGLRDYVRSPGDGSGPAGTITDDTQLSLEVARWLVAGGVDDVPDAAEFGRRVAAWGPVAIMAGEGSEGSARRLAAGDPWWLSGRPTIGNGVAMRSAAIGLRYQGDGGRIREAVARSGMTTHRHTTGVAGGVIISSLVSHLLAGDGQEPDVAAALDAAVSGLDGVRLEGHPVGAGPATATLVESVRSIESMLHLTTHEVFDHFFNGSRVTESLPCALWLFFRYGHDPERLLVEAVSGGRDADTIAAMCGNLAGARHGLDAFPARWTGDDLEFRDELETLALELYRLWAAERGSR